MLIATYLCRRTIRLIETVVRALRTHLARQVKDIERLGDLYREDGLVFTTEIGALINPTNLKTVVHIAPKVGDAAPGALPRP